LLYSDSMDAKICVDGRMKEARVLSTEELLRVADQAAALTRRLSRPLWTQPRRRGVLSEIRGSGAPPSLTSLHRV
jgi:hypothetical protein